MRRGLEVSFHYERNTRDRHNGTHLNGAGYWGGNDALHSVCIRRHLAGVELEIS